MNKMIKNPILRGFNPDPSICRVGEDYYIATSTFEWFPGVQIHHSKDLINWRALCQPLNRKSQLDMRGNPDSGGVWAPAISYADDQFWLIYSDVKRIDGNFKDCNNYLVTAPNIDGPWTDPIYLNSSGFDPSLFHDVDGKKYLLNMNWNHLATMGDAHARGKKFFDGILLQEFDATSGSLVGEIKNIFPGSDLGLTEAPHLFFKNGYYYLATAEGGTGYRHAVTHARSKSLFGPYEIHPQTHIMSSKDTPNSPLQRVGHGQYVETPQGEAYHTFLCSRPLPGTKRSPMGRETGIAKCRWDEDGWLYLDGNDVVPSLDVNAPDLPVHRWPTAETTFDFSELDTLPCHFQWPRLADTSRVFEITANALRLFGRQSIGSWFEQSLVAMRQTEWNCSAQTSLDFEPESFQQMAGLTAYYNRTQFHYLAISKDPKLGQRCLNIMTCSDWPEARLTYPLEQSVALPDTGTIWLGLDIKESDLQFKYSLDGSTFTNIGPVLDASILSDEGVRGEHSNFTGNFIGMAAQDQSGRGKIADFYDFVLANFPQDE